MGRTRSLERPGPLDRLEREHDDFRARIVLAYEQLSEADPDRIRRIDASQDPQAVLAGALDALADLL
jgi:dTMP kinase